MQIQLLSHYRLGPPHANCTEQPRVRIYDRQGAERGFTFPSCTRACLSTIVAEQCGSVTWVIRAVAKRQGQNWTLLCLKPRGSTCWSCVAGKYRANQPNGKRWRNCIPCSLIPNPHRVRTSAQCTHFYDIPHVNWVETHLQSQ